ncbi:hypothetical protein DYBT9623_00851 [Dyadobacter sp. CECT 9623]|uniref:Uncharacterized protein n=1 Tax=Dyadobacter linearis TaxID=2823330 RepID=A0ABM8UKW3_9BACT|nr:hypothetical protein [Dyadobacter sp. CECT 9623]CAG5068122.1 hypothetical protein DYBT9623_00851 [Dyadobacter sp. CECT 9623]
MELVMDFNEAGIDEVRESLDLFSYNVRVTFYGHTHDIAQNKNRSADILESLIKSAIGLTSLMDKMTAWTVSHAELPKLNGMLISLNAITNDLEAIGDAFKDQVTKEYFTLFQSSIAELREVIEDVEKIFFEYPNDPSFLLANQKLSLIK